MFNFNAAPKKKPEPAEDPTNAQKLEQTDGPAFEALKAKLRVLAAEVGTSEDHITERDIDQAAFHIALRAEEQGSPLAVEKVTGAGDEEQMDYLDSMGLRLKVRPGADEAGRVSA